MPELPDVVVYIEALQRHVGGKLLTRLRVAHPFLLRSVTPPLSAVEGHRVRELRRLGKRIVMGTDGDLWLILHLMIAGRLHWQQKSPNLRRKIDLAAFEFENGFLLVTEAGTRKRASLHLAEGEAGLQAHDPGGLEVLECDLPAFAAALVRGNHTLKRALTDPRLFSGIGNAYSDEILHRARLSPVTLTQRLSDAEVKRLHEATQATLSEWTDRLHRETGKGFPAKVTAFRTGMAVHGRYGEPCPQCGAPVQRIRYADRETNYCARCQTGGKLLADRSLSRLLKKDWPRTLEELEGLS